MNEMYDNFAIYVKDVVKCYGNKEVLKQLCMTVERGTIYGLLGASGCGKTTLLSSIVGRKKIDGGEIWVLGGKPGEPGSGVPGPRVGYMPQDIALVGEFTVKDAIYYFGRIFDMDEALIAQRYYKLHDLLELPPDDRYLKNCSGGQQRRVSLAAALVHSPELLIMDEPTVGVDPVLRNRIWNHVVEITTEHNVSVIITTHYIEEARQAHKIGLMREGRLLAEESPSRLLHIFNTETLEEVFLILSRRQEEGRLDNRNSPVADDQNNSVIEHAESTTSIGSVATFDIDHGSTDILTKKKMWVKKSNNINKNRLRALMDKNWKQFYRNITGIIFLLVFPIIQIGVFMACIGGDIKDIPLAIVNDETMTASCKNFSPEGTAISYSYTSCHFSNMSCRFLTYLDHPMITKIYFESLEEAIDSVKHGQVVGVLYLTENFTASSEERIEKGKDIDKEVLDFSEIKIYFESLEEAIDSVKHGQVVGVLYLTENFTASSEERIEKGKDIDKEVLDFSEIKVWMDMSNRQIGATMKYKLIDLYTKFQNSVFDDCKFVPGLGDFPVHMDFFYGKKDDNFTIFMTPGSLITIIFFMGAIMTSQIIITDRHDGVWDRSIVAGVTSLEITITHFILQAGVVVVQSLEMMIVVYAIAQQTYIGNIWLMYFIVFLQGLCGMSYGFWVSVISVNHSMANTVLTGIFLPMMMLSGLMWPTEGMPKALRIFAKCLPFTVSIESLRNVSKKGWTIDHLHVWNGIGIGLFWMIFFGIVSVYLIKNKR